MSSEIDWAKLPPGWKREANVMHELEHSSDRTVAILAATLVEEELSKCLEKTLPSSTKAWKRLFGRSCPLSTFSAKIDLCSLLKIVGPETYSDLHLIREIRNLFAHALLDEDDDALDFTNGRVSDWCRALKTDIKEEAESTRHQYLSTCIKLYADLALYTYSHQIDSRAPFLP